MTHAKATRAKSLPALVLGGAFATGLALAAPLALAQDEPGFSDVDFNVDGVVSQDELLAAFPDMTTDDFAMADTNGDTVITEDEYEAMATDM
ncbi:MAG: hypothetical protein AAF739_10245 [Pseudomonadota bacterium]